MQSNVLFWGQSVEGVTDPRGVKFRPSPLTWAVAVTAVLQLWNISYYYIRRRSFVGSASPAVRPGLYHWASDPPASQPTELWHQTRQPSSPPSPAPPHLATHTQTSHSQPLHYHSVQVFTVSRVPNLLLTKKNPGLFQDPREKPFRSPEMFKYKEKNMSERWQNSSTFRIVFK